MGFFDVVRGFFSSTPKPPLKSWQQQWEEEQAEKLAAIPNVRERLNAIDPALGAETAQLRVMTLEPYSWLSSRGPRHEERFFILPSLVEMHGVDALEAVLASAVTRSDFTIPDRIEAAVKIVGATLHAEAPSRAYTDDDALLAKWEPPHVVGRSYRAVISARVREAFPPTRDRALLSLVVDLETWGVTLTELGSVREPLRPVGGRLHVDDQGAPVTAPRLRATKQEAQRWRDMALSEHASIASFARLTLELMQLGAPLDLLARVQQAALDEVKHAQLCLDHAKLLDGADADVGALPALAPRVCSKQDMARFTHDEALVPESEAVRALREEAEGADEATRLLLLLLADDEERHVTLARDIIAWCES